MIATFEENEEQLLDKIKSMLGTTQYESFDFDSALYFEHGLGQFTRNYTQTTKRGLLTTNKG